MIDALLAFWNGQTKWVVFYLIAMAATMLVVRKRPEQRQAVALLFIAWFLQWGKVELSGDFVPLIYFFAVDLGTLIVFAIMYGLRQQPWMRDIVVLYIVISTVHALKGMSDASWAFIPHISDRTYIFVQHAVAYVVLLRIGLPPLWEAIRVGGIISDARQRAMDYYHYVWGGSDGSRDSGETRLPKKEQKP